MTPESLQNIATIIGAVLTIMIFSYLLSDNVLYRLAIHVFIGATAGFILITAFESVLIPWINATLLAQPADMPRIGVGLLPFLIGLLLLFKGSARRSRLGDIGLVIVIGVGTALAIWGAVNGTLLPLTSETARDLQPTTVLDGLIGVIGTTTVLLYFTYIGLRRPGGGVGQFLPVRAAGLVGQLFIVVTLGATYALLIISALTILTGVIQDRLLILVR